MLFNDSGKEKKWERPGEKKKKGKGNFGHKIYLNIRIWPSSMLFFDSGKGKGMERNKKEREWKGNRKGTKREWEGNGKETEREWRGNEKVILNTQLYSNI